MKKLLLIITSAVALMAAPVNFGTGSATGNYFKMTNDMVSEDYCGKAFTDGVNVHNTGGSLDNLDGLLNKKYSVGIIQSDVYVKASKDAPHKINDRSLSILMALHSETVHLLIPNGYEPEAKGGSLFSSLKSVFSSKPIGPVQLEALQDQTVAAWGGSVLSARALSHFFGLNWNVQGIQEAQAVSANVPLIVVGGQPYAPVEKLLSSGKWTLVSIDYNAISAKAPFYSKINASYKIKGNPVNVSTISVEALLVAKKYRSKKFNAQIEAFGQCVEDKLYDLADDPNTSPNWATIADRIDRENQAPSSPASKYSF